MTKLTFSRDIRLGEVVTAGSVVMSILGAWYALDGRQAKLEIQQSHQAVAIEAVKSDVREVRGEMREQGRALQIENREITSTVRRIEDKINRARL